MKHTLKIISLALVIGWLSSAFYYGVFVKSAEASDPPSYRPLPPLEVNCKFDFPALPAELLEGK